jgi:hypothetical protein
MKPEDFGECWGADACMLDPQCEFFRRCDLTRLPDEDDE